MKDKHSRAMDVVVEEFKKFNAIDPDTMIPVRRVLDPLRRIAFALGETINDYHPTTGEMR